MGLSSESQAHVCAAFLQPLERMGDLANALPDDPLDVVLELFAGTGSVGKVAKEMGLRVFSLDSDPKRKATVCINLLDWDYKTLPFVPSFIWASPPCTTYSVASGGKHRTKVRKNSSLFVLFRPPLTVVFSLRTTCNLRRRWARLTTKCW